MFANKKLGKKERAKLADAIAAAAANPVKIPASLTGKDPRKLTGTRFVTDPKCSWRSVSRKFAKNKNEIIEQGKWGLADPLTGEWQFNITTFTSANGKHFFSEVWESPVDNRTPSPASRRSNTFILGEPESASPLFSIEFPKPRSNASDKSKIVSISIESRINKELDLNDQLTTAQRNHQIKIATGLPYSINQTRQNPAGMEIAVNYQGKIKHESARSANDYLFDQAFFLPKKRRIQKVADEAQDFTCQNQAAKLLSKNVRKHIIRTAELLDKLDPDDRLIHQQKINEEQIRTLSNNISELSLRKQCDLSNNEAVKNLLKNCDWKSLPRKQKQELDHLLDNLTGTVTKEQLPELIENLTTNKLRRKYRRENKQAIETLNYIFRSIGERAPHRICTPHSLNLRNQQKKCWTEFAERTELSSGDKSLNLLDLITSANKKRLAEIIAITNGLQEVAQKKGMNWMFVTLTAPPRMHPNPENGHCTWDGSLPSDSHNLFKNGWAKIKDRLKEQGIIPAGTRTVEAMGDATTHWHILLFASPSQIESITDEIHRQSEFGEDYKFWGEGLKGAEIEIGDGRAKASSYIYKYILKSLSTIQQLEHDELGSNDAWRSAWNLRSFQSFGLPSIGLWRMCRKWSQPPKHPLLAKLVAAAQEDKGHGASKFIELAGGIGIKRSERPVRCGTVRIGDLDESEQQITAITEDGEVLTEFNYLQIVSQIEIDGKMEIIIEHQEVMPLTRWEMTVMPKAVNSSNLQKTEKIGVIHNLPRVVPVALPKPQNPASHPDYPAAFWEDARLIDVPEFRYTIPLPQISNEDQEWLDKSAKEWRAYKLDSINAAAPDQNHLFN